MDKEIVGGKVCRARGSVVRVILDGKDVGLLLTGTLVCLRVLGAELYAGDLEIVGGIVGKYEGAMVGNLTGNKLGGLFVVNVSSLDLITLIRGSTQSVP